MSFTDMIVDGACCKGSICSLFVQKEAMEVSGQETRNIFQSRLNRLLWFKYQSSFNIKPLYLKRHKWKVSHPEAFIDLLCVVLLCLVVHGFDSSLCHQWPTIYFTPNVQQNNILLRDSFCISDILRSRNTTCSYGFLTALKLKPVLSFKWFFQCIKTWKPERICLCACCQLKACLVYWNLFMTWYFCFCLDEFLALLCKEGIVSFPYRSSQANVFSCACLTSLVASWSDKLKQGKGCGSLTQHSCACFSVPALPFFSKSRGNGLSCPPASRKWVIDNPWTFPRGYSVAVLLWHRTARPLKWPESHSKKLYFESF